MMAAEKKSSISFLNCREYVESKSHMRDVCFGIKNESEKITHTRLNGNVGNHRWFFMWNIVVFSMFTYYFDINLGAYE